MLGAIPVECSANSPNIVRVIKYRRLRWAGHVARMEKYRSAFKILTGKPTGKFIDKSKFCSGENKM